MNRGLRLGDRPGQGTSLAWLRGLLWPATSGDAAPSGAAPRSSDRAWWILPRPTSPRVLVPIGGAPAAVSLRQFNNSMTQVARLKKVIAGEALRMAGRRVGRGRRLVVRNATDSDLIGSFLPELFGVSAIEIAISIGRELRPNIKPVLQAMTPDGVVLGYVKLGWNAVTRALVDNEARALRAWAASPPSAFEVPRVLYHGERDHLVVLVVTPVPHPIFRRGPRDAAPDPSVLEEVASLGGVRTGPLARSAYFRRLADRVGEIVDRDRDAQAARAALDALGDEAERITLTLGTWHGDWAPWNMTTTSRALHVWDWERSADDVPAGLDALHFGFEVAYHRGSTPAAALAVGLARCGATLSRLGIESHPDVLTPIYLLERLARIDEGRRADLPIDDRLRAGLLACLGGST